MAKIVGTLLLLLLMVGCVAEPQIGYVQSAPQLVKDKSDTVYIDVSSDRVISTDSGKVVISNYYGGARAECPIVLTNYSSSFINVGLAYVDIDSPKPTTSLQADGTELPYTWWPAKDWVKIQDNVVTLLSNESKGTMVVLEVPQGIEMPKRWEFRILVNDVSQQGAMQTAFEERYLVDVK